MLYGGLIVDEYSLHEVVTICLVVDTVKKRKAGGRCDTVFLEDLNIIGSIAYVVLGDELLYSYFDGWILQISRRE